jgi:aspartate aminotransferase-like enzyme
MNAPVIGHRSSEAGELFQEVSNRLRPVFGTKGAPFWITGSGTSALEAAVVNTLKQDEEALVVVTGSFGDRFTKIISRYGYHLHRLDIPWGETCSPDQLRETLRNHPKVKAVFLTHCETSTGVLNDVATLSQVVKENSDALVIVDAVSSLGGVPFQMDTWEIDIVVSGSQKALMLPPGLALVAVSERAWEKIKQNPTPRFYLDFLAYQEQLAKATTPYTPALTLLYGLREALRMMEEEGLEAVYARHRLLQQMTRTAAKALGLSLLAQDEIASPTVTAIRGCPNWEADKLRSVMKKLGVIVAGGQQQLKGKVFRIGHMGYCDPIDILSAFSVLEVSLEKLGEENLLGKGVKAAQEVWRNHV